jgi:hypothetical protein
MHAVNPSCVTDECFRALAQSHPSRNLFRIARRLFGVLIVTLAFLGTTPSAWSGSGVAQDALGGLHHCKAGPWGELDYYYAYLEMPDGLVGLVRPPNASPQWSFPGATVAGLQSLFHSARLPDSIQQHLLDSAHQVRGDNVLTVLPTAADLLAMTPQQRTTIYAELAKSDLNPSYAFPIFITSGDPDSWFAHSRLRPALRDAVKRMTYLRGEVLCFSDVEVLVGMAESEKEVHDVLRALSRTRSVVLRLHVTPQSDLEAIVRYWSGNHRNKDIEPIILSAAETQESQPLDCIHLLPPLARRYLYSYPSTDLSLSGAMPNCHWTALNFFNTTPQSLPIDGQLDIHHAMRNYAEVTPPYGFGDVLMLQTPAGFVLHSCVYIVDDIVYTKNGGSLTCPWLLMTLEDVRRLYQGLYSTEPHLHVHGYRLKS